MELNETTSPSTNHVSSNEDVPFQLDTLSSSPNTVSPNRTVSLTTDVSSIQPTVTTINCTSWDVPTDSTYEKQMLFHHPEGNYSTTNSFLISLICILGLTTVGLVIFLYMKRGLLFGKY